MASSQALSSSIINLQGQLFDSLRLHKHVRRSRSHPPLRLLFSNTAFPVNIKIKYLIHTFRLLLQRRLADIAAFGPSRNLGDQHCQREQSCPDRCRVELLRWRQADGPDCA